VDPTTPLPKVFEDPQVIAREMIVQMAHPLIDHLQLTGYPVKLSKTPVTMRHHPPLFGKHTELLFEKIGYNTKAITRLKEKYII
jgi:crotonobetainyl-CoA:carnitine CoA-transferase CaiB-like acyl-CoA transferase